MQPLFITATGTDIGKTLVTAALCWQLRARGKTVTALKPVISGYDADDMDSDTALILRSCGLIPAAPLVETISPWRFAAPVAPAMAEGTPVDMDALVKFCHEHAELAADVLLIEGAGGMMTPLTDKHTVLDWMGALGWPVILVAGSYLGAISHTLTSLIALQSKGFPIRAIILSESVTAPVSLQETASLIEKFAPKGVPIVKIPRIAYKEEPWKQVLPISWLCDEQ